MIISYSKKTNVKAINLTISYKKKSLILITLKKKKEDWNLYFYYK